MNTEALIRSSRRTVLVVEDEEINREILGMILEDSYNVLYAENGKVAIDTLRHRNGIAMILLDINMPVMNGFEFLNALHQDVRFSSIPVIVLTSDRDAEVEALQRGAMDFIPKPYDMPAVILARVARIIEFTEDRRIISDVERDPLTGLYAQNFFYEYCTTLLAEFQGKAMDMIAVNIDHFRLINEICGKSFGDKVLCAIAAGITDLLKDRFGISCRSSADLFFILVEQDADYDTLIDILTGHLAELERQRNTHLRFGVYRNVDTSHSIEWFCDAAKAAGNNIRGTYTRRIAFYDKALNEQELFQNRLVQDMDSALSNRDFRVYFQPKYSVQGEKPVLCGAEALVRWIHPELGFISPGKFIPVFEENGLITRLDSYVWNEAAACIRRWKEQYGFSPPVSVNVSRQDLFDRGLLERMLDIVKHNGISCADLSVEVTESAYAQDVDHMLRTVADLRNAGFPIEMDDFGSGYSSLNMLCLMPIDKLKIDMKFVQNMLHAGSGYSILEFVIDLAHRLNLPTVVEGVEDQEQFDMVKQAGCDIIQGYYFSKPVEAADFERLLQA